MASEGTWDDLVKGLARDLAYSLKEELYWAHYQRLKAQEATSEKLVYLHLLRSQPQTFSGILRSLDLSSYTVDQALRRLRARGHIVQDSSYLYWVSEPETLSNTAKTKHMRHLNVWRKPENWRNRGQIKHVISPKKP